eukprot:sb/3470309/
MQRQIHKAQQAQMKEIQKQEQQQQAQIINLSPNYTVPKPPEPSPPPPPHVQHTTPSPVTTSTVPTTTSPSSIIASFSEYTNELNDVLQISSEILNITPPTTAVSPTSQIVVQADKQDGGLSAEDILEKLQKISADGELNGAEILQGLSSSQITLLTNQLELGAMGRTEEEARRGDGGGGGSNDDAIITFGGKLFDILISRSFHALTRI